MPRPLSSHRPYVQGLDGIRAIAVVAFLGGHLRSDWVPGGQLGITIFFVLSGFLITDVLLVEASAGRMDLKRFWIGRAQRLLPALLLMIAITGAWVTLREPALADDFWAATATSLTGVNNWWLATEPHSFLTQFLPPGPLDHLWALSILLQFYVLWPFLLIAGLRFRPRVTATGARPGPCALILCGILGSFGLMLLLRGHDPDASRVLYGTDARAAELLIGAALAAARPSASFRGSATRGVRMLADVSGLIGAVAVAVLVVSVDPRSPFLFDGGYLLVGVATALLIVAVSTQGTRLASLLSLAPLRWVGERSYGIFLWGLPIVALTRPEGTAAPGVLRTVLQIAATLAVASLSWRYLEVPFRGGSAARAWRKLRKRGVRPTLRLRAGLFVAGFLAGVAVAGFAGAETPPAHDAVVTVAETQAHDPIDFAARTSCRQVIHVGDPTSAGVATGSHLPARFEIGAQYHSVGVSTRHLDIADARTVDDRYDGEAGAADLAQRWIDDGYKGCWVLAIGTNDVGEAATGSSDTIDDRIDSLMNIIGDQPVMWVNLKTRLGSGPLRDDEMKSWNAALQATCASHPKMRIFDWAKVAKDDWFADDGVRYSVEGDEARSVLTAAALSKAFPPTGDSSGKGPCLIKPPASAVRSLTAPPTPISVGFAGDITPGSSYGLPPDNARAQFGGVRGQVSDADIAVGNLEGTLSEGGASKCGADTSTCFSFQAPPANADGLSWGGFDVFNLGNNHALDFGADGQDQTISALQRYDLAHTGLPHEITITEVGTTTVAFVGFAPYEWSNPIDDLEGEARLVRVSRTQADIVVVVAHVGAEGADQGHTPLGTEYAFGEDRGDTRAFAHAAIDAGASLVLGSGPHVLRGVEHYHQGLIAYSLGNFAGWDNFSTSGALGESAFLRVDLSAAGKVEGGNVVPLRLVGLGVPAPDRTGAAIAHMNTLSREDFGADGVEFDPTSGDFKMGSHR